MDQISRGLFLDKSYVVNKTYWPNIVVGICGCSNQQQQPTVWVYYYSHLNSLIKVDSMMTKVESPVSRSSLGGKKKDIKLFRSLLCCGCQVLKSLTFSVDFMTWFSWAIMLLYLYIPLNMDVMDKWRINHIKNLWVFTHSIELRFGLSRPVLMYVGRRDRSIFICTAE